jgi:hypothetical protein
VSDRDAPDLGIEFESVTETDPALPADVTVVDTVP